MRIGFGYDSHRLVEGRSLILGGMEIPHERGLLGHSDADVLIHAICDAILGAAGGGDIGMHFPDTAPEYKNISSMRLLRQVSLMAEEKGFLINNVDSTIVIEKPKLAGYLHEMIMNISDVLCISRSRVNVKAKTNEGMGFVGRSEGVVAFAVVTVMEKSRM
ncbi:MAG: 2-C-methyl-D-erythritol 2,4-cyclodiphosphate synthase [Deltaproteobacteria bacterium]|nr:2-C-methyl-D-erythritol 2,4-cyclodiphosphate synthase [Deltaproteobacteria bacterium]